MKAAFIVSRSGLCQHYFSKQTDSGTNMGARQDPFLGGASISSGSGEDKALGG
jgi:hypothetical protein